MIRRLLRGWSRLALIDVPEQFSPTVPVLLSQAAFALLCASATVLVRTLTDLFLPGAGPFALTIPTTLVATLFGRWQCGVICLLLSWTHAWYFVLPEKASFGFLDPTDGPRVAVNIVAGLFVVALAEIFRRAIYHALEERELLLLELEHRVKNNFASVAALLRLQQNKAKDPEVARALQTATGRVESFAHANSMFYRSYDRIGSVNLARYLPDLCQSMQKLLPPEPEITVTCITAPVELHRDQAILIGLLVNEVATNAVKHAFKNRTHGRIDIMLQQDGKNYRLEIADNGNGITKRKGKDSMGMSLIESLTHQAGGTFEMETSGAGTNFIFQFES